MVNTFQIYIVGQKDSEDTKKLLRIVRERLIPGRILILADGEGPENILYNKNDIIGKMKQLNGRATAFVCHHHVCSLPITEPEDLASILDKRNQQVLQ